MNKKLEELKEKNDAYHRGFSSSVDEAYNLGKEEERSIQLARDFVFPKELPPLPEKLEGKQVNTIGGMKCYELSVQDRTINSLLDCMEAIYKINKK
jgi:hypothetical protein